MSNQPLPAPPADVATVINGYPADIRKKLNGVRDLILQTAASIEEVGPLTETLKWGEPAYLTEATKSGSTIRFAWKASAPDQYGIFFNCNSRLIGQFRKHYSDDLTFEGNRAIVFHKNDRIPKTALRGCIKMALTYHRNK